MKTDMVEFIGEDGQIEKFIVEATFELDDTKYVILTGQGREESNIYRIEEEDGESVFVAIEDKKELDEAIEAYESLV